MDCDRLDLHHALSRLAAQLHLRNAAVLSVEEVTSKAVQPYLFQSQHLRVVCVLYFLEGSLGKQVGVGNLSLLIAEQH